MSDLDAIREAGAAWITETQLEALVGRIQELEAERDRFRGIVRDYEWRTGDGKKLIDAQKVEEMLADAYKHGFADSYAEQVILEMTGEGVEEWCAVEGCQEAPTLLCLGTSEFVCRKHLDYPDAEAAVARAVKAEAERDTLRANVAAMAVAEDYVDVEDVQAALRAALTRGAGDE